MEGTVNVKQLILFTLGTALMGFGMGYMCGNDVGKSNTKIRTKEIVSHADANQDAIEHRALSLREQECYTQEDIDYIIFGESQE